MNPSYTETVLEIMESIDTPEAEQVVETIKEEKQKRLVEIVTRKQEDDLKKEQEEIEKREKAEKEKTTCLKSCGGCSGCLSVFIILMGFNLLNENKTIWAIVLFVIGGLFMLGTLGAFIQADQKKETTANNQARIDE